MKIYLKENGNWKLFENPTENDFSSRHIIIGKWAKIGDGANIGDGARIGNGATIGNGANIGDGARIGDRATIGDVATIGKWANIGDGANIGDEARIGDRANIGKEDTTAYLNQYFIAIHPEVFMAWKWVKFNFMSPGWGRSSPIKYDIGATLEIPYAVVSDRQCAPGLHVFRVGIRPEFMGLCTPEETNKLICLEVEVKREDICFGGLPGNADKLRVKKLKVIRVLPPNKYYDSTH